MKPGRRAMYLLQFREPPEKPMATFIPSWMRRRFTASSWVARKAPMSGSQGPFLCQTVTTIHLSCLARAKTAGVLLAQKKHGYLRSFSFEYPGGRVTLFEYCPFLAT